MYFKKKQDVFVKHKCPLKWPIPNYYMAKVTRTNILISVGRSHKQK